MERLTFCYVIDNNKTYLDMLGKSIRSLVRSLGSHEIGVCVVSLVEKGSNDDNVIFSVVKESCGHIPYTITHFDVHISLLIPFPINSKNANFLGYNALSRFFIPYIVSFNNVYYTDTDIIFVKDIYEKLVSFDRNDTLMRIWIQHGLTNYHSTDRINSGFIYINCKLWKKRKTIFRDILTYFATNQLKIEFLDQDCFDWIVSERCKDTCIIENDISINNKNMFDGVELFHGFGEDKSYFMKMYEEYEKKYIV